MDRRLELRRPTWQIFDVVEICAGAGGQALGLERAGFEHALAVELDAAACATLRANRPGWKVAEGDVADQALWRPRDYRGVALLAGGVPCPTHHPWRATAAPGQRKHNLYVRAVELCGGQGAGGPVYWSSWSGG